MRSLYDPAYEHDACGVAFVADIAGRRSHDVVRKGLSALCRLDHRGARGAEPTTGDGAGILLQVPDAFLREAVEFELPSVGAYATGLVFLPSNGADEARAITVLEKYALVEGADILGWRDVPVNPEGLGATAEQARPRIRQVFLSAHRLDTGQPLTGLELERVAYIVRKQTERETRERGVPAYFPSLSGRTLVYKGMLTPDQLVTFYPDLADERVVSAIALVHSRFSTNTFPSWPLAHPYRFIAHNGEINTVRGNVNWMRAREALLASPLLPGNLRRLFPVCTPGGSDSASFDEVLELLHLTGRSLPHALLMMIPEAWENDPMMDPAKRAFYKFHASLMEPWDGPASVSFTDGTIVGAVLDRNGLRPGRWWRTSDGLVVLGSEAGMLDLDPATIVAKGRLEPGRIFLVDTVRQRVIEDDEIKRELAAEQPYQDWLHGGLMHLEGLPARKHQVYTHDSVQRRQQTFGYTEEELKLLLAPMARTGSEPLGSMGTDTPISPLSTRPRLLYDYFHQIFAQVTNPPLDAIREEMVTSLSLTIGPESNLLDPGPASCRQIVLPYPVIDNDDLAKILSINDDGDMPGFKAVRVSGLYPLRDGASGLKSRLVEICRHVSEAIDDGVRILVLSDRDSTADLAPIPSLLLTAAVHQHLVREQTRTQAALVIESGDCRDVHHAAVLIGYGAAALNPYLAFESVEDLISTGALTGIAPEKAIHHVVKGLGKGIQKIMSKMGISTVSSYCGAQVFEAVGLSSKLVERYFTGTPSKIEGITLNEIHAEVAARHAVAYPANPAQQTHRRLEVGGEWQWRREGELHLFNPETVFLLQHATRSGQFGVFQSYTEKVDQLAAQAGSLRGLLKFKHTTPIPLDQVEPVSAIVKRFATGAMSYGSISAEAHETLAIAMSIGPEVMAEVKKLIAWMNANGMGSFETEEGLVGGCCYDAHKVAITDATMAKAHAADAVIFGAVGGPKWDAVPYDVRPEAGLLRLRKDLGLFANIRPAICYPALAESSSLKREVVDGLDIIIVREGTGGVYFGEPKAITDLGNGQKRAVDTQVYDTYEIERISRIAFELAKKRRNKVTSMEKRNVMKTGVLWHEVVIGLHAREFKDVTLEHQLADAGGMQLVRWPKQFDVIVTDNLFGDMLSDIAAMLTGSLGMLPSASLGEVDPKTKKRKAMYEPVHGSAPDIAGKGIANPIAMIASFGMALRYSLNRPKEADLIDQAIAATLAKGLRTADIKSDGTTVVDTAQMGTAILREIEQLSA